MNVHWKDWYWSWSSNTLATWCKELTDLKRPWFWESWTQEEKGTTEDEMVRWHHRLSGHAAAAAKLLQLCPTLCDPIEGSSPGSPIPGIFQARTLEWVAISFSNAWKWKVKSEIEVAQSCPTLSYPMDCSSPGFSIHRILQARVLEWSAIGFSGVDMSLSKVWELVMNMESWHA